MRRTSRFGAVCGVTVFVWLGVFLTTVGRSAPVAATLTIPPLPSSPPTAPGGAHVFLRFLESFQVEDDQTATAYYKAVDPYNRRTTLKKWLETNQFLTPGAAWGPPGTAGAGAVGDANVAKDALAMYINGADLGFGRRMYLRRNANGALASYVENYVGTSDAVKLANVKFRDPAGLLATVCMEFVAPDENPTGKKRVTFYTYGANGNRVLQADLDDRGPKAGPGVCNVCHGGKPQALLVDGSYPKQGDTGAYFLPWDVDTFAFDTAPGFTRADQESQFKNLNQAVLAHHSQQAKYDEVSRLTRQRAPVELIKGWYGNYTTSPTNMSLPNPTFDGSFVAKGWKPSAALGIPAGADAIYRNVMGPYCRACHAQRESSLDLATFKGFKVHRDNVVNLVFTKAFKLSGKTPNGTRPGDDGTVMPLALRTYENFWSSSAPQALRTFLNSLP